MSTVYENSPWNPRNRQTNNHADALRLATRAGDLLRDLHRLKREVAFLSQQTLFIWNELSIDVPALEAKVFGRSTSPDGSRSSEVI